MSTEATPIILGQRIRPRREDSGTSDLQQMITKIIGVLLQRKWFFILPLLTGMLASLTFSMFLPRRYVVNTIFERRDDDVVSKMRNAKTPYDYENFRKSLNIDVHGYHAMSRALAQLGMTDQLPRDTEGNLTAEGRQMESRMIGYLNQHIHVGVMEKSDFLDLIEVRYAGSDPEMGVKLVKQLKDNYVEYIQDRMRGILTESHDYLKTKADKAMQEVALLETQLSKMSREHPGIDPTNSGVLDSRLQQIELKLLELAREKTKAENSIAMQEQVLKDLHALREGKKLPVTSQPARTQTIYKPNPEREKMARRIEELQRNIADERDQGKLDRHPDVARLIEKRLRLREELARLPAQIETTVEEETQPFEPGDTRGIDAQIRRVEMEITSARTRQEELQRDVERLTDEKNYYLKEKEMLSERQQDYVILQEDLASERSNLNTYKRQVEDMKRILQADEEDRGIHFATIVDARPPTRPNSPALKGVIFMSVCVGLALAVAATFLREVLDRSVRSPSRIQNHLGIPVLEAVGEIRTSQTPILGFRTKILTTVALLEVLAVLAMGAIVYFNLQEPLIYNEIIGRISALLPF